MKIPESIKLGGHVLKVIQTTDKNIISEDEIGNTTIAENVIRLNTKYPQTRLESALLHEIIHNVLFEYNQEQSEEIVQCLASGLYQVLKDNKLHFDE